jgi:two-component system LytT family response regulator
MRPSSKIRALLVDDEPLARRRLRRLLSSDDEIEIVGECADGKAAISAIREFEPEIVFLDVQMPGIDGFEVIERLRPEELPLVIFVTAYEQYALRAFEVSALDYLLKPFDRARFSKTLERAKAFLRSAQDGEIRRQTLALLEHLQGRNRHLERILVKSPERAFFLKTAEIDWIEAEGKYVRLHVNKDSHLIRESISALESQLDPNQFPRIHRSAIVNIERIKELQPWFKNGYRVILRDGTELVLSRSCRKRLGELLGASL